MNFLVKQGLNSLALKSLANRTMVVAVRANHTNNNIVPINDIGNSDPDAVERRKLAATYRLVATKGWDWNIYNHITVRSQSNPHHFFINPFGLLYSEITASSLLKIDSQCNVIERGSTTYGLNKAGFVLHSVIHNARPDLNAIIHLHTGLAAGLSALKAGLLPVSQEALIIGNVSYHDYAGILVDDAMKERIRKDLGDKNRIMILRNHGVVFCGRNIEEAWFFLFNFMYAAQIQFQALAAAPRGIEDLNVPPKHVLEQVQRVLQTGVNEKSPDGIDWKIGEMDFEAEMRQLDRLGYNTGYPYRKPANK